MEIGLCSSLILDGSCDFRPQRGGDFTSGINSSKLKTHPCFLLLVCRVLSLEYRLRLLVPDSMDPAVVNQSDVYSKLSGGWR